MPRNNLSDDELLELVSSLPTARVVMIGDDDGWGIIDTSNEDEGETVAPEDIDDEEPDEDEEVRLEHFPALHIVWNNRFELERAIDAYYSQIEYRTNWIFYRMEKEGFRRRQAKPYSPEDILKRGGKHDWNMAATDFIMKLEALFINGKHCLRCKFLYKPNNMIVGYTDRVWNGKHYASLFHQWAELEV